MNSKAASNLIFESISLHNNAAKNSSNILSPAMTMLQVQMLMAESCDDQIRDIADKLKFLKDVSQAYRDNINTVTTCLAAPTKESHHGKKPVIVTTAAQGADLLKSLTTYSYNMDAKTMTSQGINLVDLESKHAINNEGTRQSSNVNNSKNTTPTVSKAEINSLRGGIGGTEYLNAKKAVVRNDINKADNSNSNDETPANGLTNTLELGGYCDGLAKISDRGEYIAEAKKLGDNPDLRLPFYYSKESNDGLDGKPVMTFYTESIEKLMQVMQSKMDGLETEIDKLTTQLTDLTEKRKSALDSANAIIRKINEVNTNTLSKM